MVGPTLLPSWLRISLKLVVSEGHLSSWVVRCPSVDAQFLLVTSAALLLSSLGWIYYLWFLAPPVVAVVSTLTTCRTA